MEKTFIFCRLCLLLFNGKNEYPFCYFVIASDLTLPIIVFCLNKIASAKFKNTKDRSCTVHCTLYSICIVVNVMYVYHNQI